MSRGVFGGSGRIFLVCANLLLPTAVRADPAGPAQIKAAMALYDEANKHIDAHEYDLACPKLEKVTQDVPEALGAQLMLAKCYEGQGKLASAWRRYTKLISLTEQTGDERRLKEARERAAALESRLATVVVEVPEEVASIPEVSVVLDATELPKEQWGKAVPLDKGIHVIDVAAKGRETWAKVIEVDAERQRFHVVVEPPAEKEATEVPPADQQENRQTNMKKPVPKKPKMEVVSPRKVSRWQRPLGIGMLSTGAGSIALGAVLGGLAIARNDEANDGHCIDDSSLCRDQTGIDLRDDALTLAAGSSVAFVMGGALLVGGTVFLLTAPSHSGGKERSTRAMQKNSLWVRGGLGHISVGGTW